MTCKYNIVLNNCFDDDGFCKNDTSLQNFIEHADEESLKHLYVSTSTTKAIRTAICLQFLHTHYPRTWHEQKAQSEAAVMKETLTREAFEALMLAIQPMLKPRIIIYPADGNITCKDVCVML